MSNLMQSFPLFDLQRGQQSAIQFGVIMAAIYGMMVGNWRE